MQNQVENFDALRHALKLKRHEQPPPGYFNHFSRDVVARIRDLESPDRLTNLDRMEWESPWLTRILAAFQAKPAYAGIIGATACALMIGGIVYSERGDSTQSLTQAAPGSVAIQNPLPGIGIDPATANATAVWSTNPVVPLGGSMFDQYRLNQNPQNASQVGSLLKP